MNPSRPPSNISTILDSISSIGIQSYSERSYQKAARKGITFNLAVIGEKGLGKTSVIEALFGVNLETTNTKYQSSVSSPPISARKVKIQVKNEIGNLHLLKHSFTVEIEPNKMEPFSLHKKSNSSSTTSLKMYLNIIEFPNYNESLDKNLNMKYPKIFNNFLLEQFDKFFNDENSVNRKNMSDSRIHACLYFINPNQRSWKAFDINFLKKNIDWVNIIPVIGFADMLTVGEKKLLKQNLIREAESLGLLSKFYREPGFDQEDMFFGDLEFKNRITRFREKFPFAVIGPDKNLNDYLEKLSMTKITALTTYGQGISQEIEELVNLESIRDLGYIPKLARSYNWGICDIQNDEFCDFNTLRDLFIHHISDLIEITNDDLYEKYRAARILESQKIWNTNLKSGEDQAERLMPLKKAYPETNSKANATTTDTTDTCVSVNGTRYYPVKKGRTMTYNLPKNNNTTIKMTNNTSFSQKMNIGVSNRNVRNNTAANNHDKSHSSRPGTKNSYGTTSTFIENYANKGGSTHKIGYLVDQKKDEIRSLRKQIEMLQSHSKGIG